MSAEQQAAIQELRKQELDLTNDFETRRNNIRNQLAKLQGGATTAITAPNNGTNNNNAELIPFNPFDEIPSIPQNQSMGTPWTATTPSNNLNRPQRFPDFPPRDEIAQHSLDRSFYAGIASDTSAWRGADLLAAKQAIRAEVKERNISMNPLQKPAGATLLELARLIKRIGLPAEFLFDAVKAAAEPMAYDAVSEICDRAHERHINAAHQLDALAHDLATLTVARNQRAIPSALTAFADACTSKPSSTRAHITRLERALADLLHLIRKPLSAADAELGIASSIIEGLPHTAFTLSLKQLAAEAYEQGRPLTAAAILNRLSRHESILDDQLHLHNNMERLTRSLSTRPGPSNNKPVAFARAAGATSPDADDGAAETGTALVLHVETTCKCDPDRRRHEPGPACAQTCSHPVCVAAGLTHPNDSCFKQNPGARRTFRPRRN